VATTCRHPTHRSPSPNPPSRMCSSDGVSSISTCSTPVRRARQRRVDDSTHPPRVACCSDRQVCLRTPPRALVSCPCVSPCRAPCPAALQARWRETPAP
jgi:hypothetical protein